MRIYQEIGSKTRNWKLCDEFGERFLFNYMNFVDDLRLIYLSGHGSKYFGYSSSINIQSLSYPLTLQDS